MLVLFMPLAPAWILGLPLSRTHVHSEGIREEMEHRRRLAQLGKMGKPLPMKSGIHLRE
ncbi:MAG: hypothetical protein PHG20_03785 [Geobacteraceae bacterium]|nr:hypothetical protein [Geobacteraceae bacterium]